MNKILEIAYDSREQKPVHDLEGQTVNGVKIHYVERPLYVFDYACNISLTPTKGKLMIPTMALERKGLGDLVSSLFNGKNFKRELAKIKKAKELWGNAGGMVAYVVEGDYEAIGKFNYSRFPSGRVTAKAVVSKIHQMMFDHNVHMILCRSRIEAEYTIVSLLKKQWIKDRFRLAVSKKSII
jgi:ERCC4-type nuclease